MHILAHILSAKYLWKSTA